MKETPFRLAVLFLLATIAALLGGIFWRIQKAPTRGELRATTDERRRAILEELPVVYIHSGSVTADIEGIVPVDVQGTVPVEIERR